MTRWATVAGSFCARARFRHPCSLLSGVCGRDGGAAFVVADRLKSA